VVLLSSESTCDIYMMYILFLFLQSGRQDIVEGDERDNFYALLCFKGRGGGAIEGRRS
jgi:hypothetical protein